MDSPPGCRGLLPGKRRRFPGQNVSILLPFTYQIESDQRFTAVYISQHLWRAGAYYYATAQILVKQGKPAPAITLLQSEIYKVEQDNVRKRVCGRPVADLTGFTSSGKTNEAYQNLLTRLFAE